MLRRIAALVMGAAIIAGGLAVRQSRDPDSPRNAEGARENPYDVFEDDEVSLVCADDLMSLCRQFTNLLGPARPEPVWTTAGRLSRGEALGADAWVTFRPWDGVARERPGGGSPLADTLPFATTTIAVVGPPPVVDGIEQRCPDPSTTLACAAELEQPLLLPDPRSAKGALVLAAVAAEMGVPPDATVIADPGVRERLTAIVRRARVTQVPVEDVVRLKGRAAALTLESDVVAVVDDADAEALRTYDALALRYPLPARAVDVVVVPAAGFRRTNELAAVLQSDAARFDAERAGLEAPGDVSYVLKYARPFANRPTVRSDLPPPSAGLLGDLQALLGERGAPGARR